MPIARRVRSAADEELIARLAGELPRVRVPAAADEELIASLQEAAELRQLEYDADDQLAEARRNSTLGNRLHPLIQRALVNRGKMQQQAYEQACKITGMLLELPDSEVERFIASKEALADKVTEALDVLRKRKEDTASLPPPPPPPPALDRETSRAVHAKLMEDWMCPITLQLMVDPVLCEDGKSYERKAWEQFAKGSRYVKSPTSRASISGTNFFPNIGLRNTIRAMIDMRGSELLDAEEYLSYYLAEAIRCEGKDNAEAEKAFLKVLESKSSAHSSGGADADTPCFLRKNEACVLLVGLKLKSGNLSGALEVMKSHASASAVLHREHVCLLALRSAKDRVEDIRGTYRFVEETGRAVAAADGGGGGGGGGGDDPPQYIPVEKVTLMLDSLTKVLQPLETAISEMEGWEGDSRGFARVEAWAREKAAAEVGALKALQAQLVIAREMALVEQFKSRGDEASAKKALEAAEQAGFRPPNDWFSFLREGDDSGGGGGGDSSSSPTTELVANALRHPLLSPICKVLRQVHPDLFLTIGAAAAVTDICGDLLQRIAKAMQPGWLMRRERARAIRARDPVVPDIDDAKELGTDLMLSERWCVLGPNDYDFTSVEDAVKTIFTVELTKHAKNEGAKAVKKFQGIHYPQTFIYKASSSRPRTATFDESQRMVWRNQDWHAEEVFLMAMASDPELSFVTSAHDLTSHAGLQFYIQPVGVALEELLGDRRITPDAVVYLAAVLEYITAEVLELAGNAAKDFKAQRISPQHITLALENDEELFSVFKDRHVVGGGVNHLNRCYAGTRLHGELPDRASSELQPYGTFFPGEDSEGEEEEFEDIVYVTGEIFPEGSFQVLHDEIFKKSLNEDAVMSHYEDGYDYYWPKGAFELKNKKTEGITLRAIMAAQEAERQRCSCPSDPSAGTMTHAWLEEHCPDQYISSTGFARLAARAGVLALNKRVVAQDIKDILECWLREHFVQLRRLLSARSGSMVEAADVARVFTVMAEHRGQSSMKLRPIRNMLGFGLVPFGAAHNDEWTGTAPPVPVPEDHGAIRPIWARALATMRSQLEEWSASTYSNMFLAEDLKHFSNNDDGEELDTFPLYDFLSDRSQDRKQSNDQDDLEPDLGNVPSSDAMHLHGFEGDERAVLRRAATLVLRSDHANQKLCNNVPFCMVEAHAQEHGSITIGALGIDFDAVVANMARNSTVSARIGSSMLPRGVGWIDRMQGAASAGSPWNEGDRVQLQLELLKINHLRMRIRHLCKFKQNRLDANAGEDDDEEEGMQRFYAVLRSLDLDESWSQGGPVERDTLGPQAATAILGAWSGGAAKTLKVAQDFTSRLRAAVDGLLSIEGTSDFEDEETAYERGRFAHWSALEKIKLMRQSTASALNHTEFAQFALHCSLHDPGASSANQLAWRPGPEATGLWCSRTALLLLQEAAEVYLVGLLEDAVVASGLRHQPVGAGDPRKMWHVIGKDIGRARMLRGELT